MITDIIYYATRIDVVLLFIGPPQMQGFVMALDYSDQMTGSSANVMNLQCFIGHHVKGVKVIEPFIHPKGSLFGVSLSPSYSMSQGYKLKLEEINSVKLSDVLDINEWQHYASSRRYSPLVSWSNFTKNCPKKLILVYISQMGRTLQSVYAGKCYKKICT